MKTSVSGVQKEFGELLINISMAIEGEWKIKIPLIAIIELLLWRGGKKIVLSSFVIIVSEIILNVVLFIMLLIFAFALIEFAKRLFSNIGIWFVKKSKSVKFSFEIVTEVEEYTKKDFFLKVTNSEWFEDAKNVNCTIGLGAYTEDSVDLGIREIYKSSRSLKKSIPFHLSGKWISRTEDKVGLDRCKSETMQFINTDIQKNEIVVIGNDISHGRSRDTSLPPGKRIFVIHVRGEAKNGIFEFSFQIESTYHGKDKIEMKIIGDRKIATEVSFPEERKFLWS